MISCREQLAEVTENKITDYLKEDIITTQRRNGLNGHLKWNRLPGKKQVLSVPDRIQGKAANQLRRGFCWEESR